MDGLTETKGKGVIMFAQRRQRMDAIAMEHEELRRKGLPVEGITEFQHTGVERTYMQEIPQANQDYTGSSPKQNKQNIQEMNPVPKPLVPNRTAKPFLGFQETTTVFSPVVAAPVAKKHELKFKVPVPINSSPQVWSPTGDIIASRDERISVPAIRTGILPESKRRSTKHSLMPNQASDLYNQNKGDRRSYNEPEEDFFSLGAEACNFMQPRTVKLKVPPPVAPKPNLKPSSPPKMQNSPSLEPFKAPRSPVSSASPSAVPHTQNASQQRDLAKLQLMPNPWAPIQSQAPIPTPTNAKAPVNLSSQPQLQLPINSRSPKPAQLPVSMKASSPLHAPSTSRSKPPNATNSVSSCPPSQRNPSPAVPSTPWVQVSDKAVSPAADGPTLRGKGAELFAKRQSRMEKFVVDGETVQANRPRSPSPTSSLPNSWRYSPNVRAPPPLSYNPLLAPFYPPAAAKQLPSTSPTIKPKTKSKPKAPKKHLSSLDVMKHQPYQLDSSLFKYDAITEAKSPSPKPSPDPISEVSPAPKPSPVPYYSCYNGGDLADQGKSKAPKKTCGSVSCLEQGRSGQPLSVDKQLDEKLTIPSTTHHIASKQALSTQTLKSTSCSPFSGNSLEHFSPASLIARGARQMAPRPKFSAKNPVLTSKQWRPILMQH